MNSRHYVVIVAISATTVLTLLCAGIWSPNLNIHTYVAFVKDYAALRRNLLLPSNESLSKSAYISKNASLSKSASIPKNASQSKITFPAHNTSLADNTSISENASLSKNASRNDFLKERYFIFQCKNGQECGGLADRQKGIVTAYVISQIIGDTFGIDYDKPCKLSNYLVPNSVNWIINPKALAQLKRKTHIRIGRKKQDEHLAYENITSVFKGDVIYYKGNIDLVSILMRNPRFKKLPWVKGLSHYDIYKYVNDKLFKLSAKTQKKLDSFLQKAGKGKLICAHLRTGKSPTIPNDDARTLTAPDPDTVIQFLKKRAKNVDSYKIFLATDSNSVREKFRKAFPQHFIEIEGKIIHVNLAAANRDCSGMEKAILDHKVLTLCDTLVMSHSGFSRTAALFRGTDDNLFVARMKNITATKRLEPSFNQMI